MTAERVSHASSGCNSASCAFSRPGIAILWVSVLSFALSASGCTIETSTTSVTEAGLRRVEKILSTCSGAGGQPIATCLDEYAQRSGTTVATVTTDAFGQGFVLTQSAECSDTPFCGPYSIGRDSTDDCGGGDDIVLRDCAGGRSGIRR